MTKRWKGFGIGTVARESVRRDFEGAADRAARWNLPYTVAGIGSNYNGRPFTTHYATEADIGAGRIRSFAAEDYAAFRDWAAQGNVPAIMR